MSSISMIGSYSGIDRSTIDQLMQAEKMPLVGLSSKKTDATEKQNAWKDINTRLNSLFDRIKALQNSDIYNSKAVTSSNEDQLMASVTDSAAEGVYNIEVQGLASATRLIGSEVTIDKTTDAIGTEGVITIKNGDIDSELNTINIDKEDSLNTIMDKINEKTADTGIKATIIAKRLVLEDSKTGDRTITLGGDVLADIGLDAPEEKAGSIAKFAINGIYVERSSNIVDDVVEGVAISLKNTHAEGASDTLTVSMDSGKTEKAVEAFVTQYNSTMSFIESKMSAGTPGMASSRGVLAGDGTLQRLHSSLRQMVSSSISNDENTTIKDVSALGITTTDKFGKLTFDSSKLREQLGESTENVMNFFSNESTSGKDVGFSHRLSDYVDSFISKDNGIIKGKTNSFERSLKDIDRQIENFNRRIEKKEEYYVKMFTALDVAMMQAESQMEWLTGQITAMNAQTSANK